MARKEASLPYQIFNAQSISGTSVLTSSVTTIQYRDSFSVQLQWTGTLTGVFEIQGCNDYLQGIPQTGGPANVGTWTDIPFQNTSGAIITSVSVGSGSAQPVLVNLSNLGFSYLRTVFTNSTSTGILTGWVAGKSYG